MASLVKILNEIQSLQEFANENVEAGPIETMAGRRGRKAQAIERLKSLKNEYRDRMLETAVFIVTTGEKRDEFANLATSKFKCFNANPNAFYEELATKLEPAFRQSRESVPNLFDILGRYLEDKMASLGVVAYPQLLFRQEYQVSVNDTKGLTDLIRRAINDQVGPEIVGINAVNGLVGQAIADGHSSKTTPIVLATDNVKLATDLENSLGRLRPKGVFLVVAGKGTKELKAMQGVVSVKDPTEEEVEKTLKAIKGATAR